MSVSRRKWLTGLNGVILMGVPRKLCGSIESSRLFSQITSSHHLLLATFSFIILTSKTGTMMPTSQNWDEVQIDIVPEKSTMHKTQWADNFKIFQWRGSDWEGWTPMQ